MPATPASHIRPRGHRPATPGLRSARAKTILTALEDRGEQPGVIESKVRIPQPGPTSVSRTALVNRLRAAGAFPTLLVVAPAGYGKTTLLAQWSARDARPFAWVCLDTHDNDPMVLLTHVAEAIDRNLPAADLAGDDNTGASRGSFWHSAVPKVTTRMASSTSPFVLVLDNADLLESKESVDAVGALIENIPAGSMLAMAGRAMPSVSVAARRVAGPLLEVGPFELALSRREAELLLRSLGVELHEDEFAELLRRTEGWPAGIYLAALAVRETTDAHEPFALGGFDGDDRYLADYFRSEYLDQLTPDLVRFLRRTSVLEKMCASLCDSVLETTDTATPLEAIAYANLFVASLDRNRVWFRYHPLFRTFLRSELERHEPELVPALNARAAAWCEAHADLEAALAHARAAGDFDGAARLLTSIAFDVRDRGRVAAVEEWLDYFDDDELLERYPAVAIHGCSTHALLGRTDEAERYLHAAERGSRPGRKAAAHTRALTAAMRAALCAGGPKRMEGDARSALAKLPNDDQWRPSALLSYGTGAFLAGEPDRADAIMVEAAEEAQRLCCNEARAVAIAERSLIAAAREDHRRADALALEAYGLVERGELAEYTTSALPIAVSARALLRQGQWDQARQRLTWAERLTPRLTAAIPWLAVQVRLELGHAHVALRDREGAGRLLDEISAILATRPQLGDLVPAYESFADALAGMPGKTGAAGLTAAELRLLPLLTTHLSFREIGERLYVSRNTIKTQAISIYRKLGASSRSEAIARAATLGLVESDTDSTGSRAGRGASSEAA